MSDSPPASLRETVDAAIHRRRVLLMSSVTLVVLVVLNLGLIVGVGVLVWHDRADRAGDRRRAEAGQQIIADVYGALNEANSRLARIEGRGPATLIVPPGATTTTTLAARPPTTVRPSATTSTSTTASTRPPASQPTSSTSTSRPAPSTTTTTTGAPCATLPVVGVCRPGGQ